MRIYMRFAEKLRNRGMGKLHFGHKLVTISTVGGHNFYRKALKNRIYYLLLEAVPTGTARRLLERPGVRAEQRSAGKPAGPVERLGAPSGGYGFRGFFDQRGKDGFLPAC